MENAVPAPYRPELGKHGLETILAYIRSTTTRAGLRVSAYLNDTQYQKGIKITDQEMQRLNISSDDQIPRWNYTIKPR